MNFFKTFLHLCSIVFIVFAYDIIEKSNDLAIVFIAIATICAMFIYCCKEVK